MKTRLTAFSMLLLTATAMAAPQVDRVLVRQQWPWSHDVRIEYVVSGASAPAEVSFTFRNAGTTLVVADGSALKGDAKYAGNGTHVVTFNPRELFGPAAPVEYTAFSVEVTLGAEVANMGDKLYRVVDLDTGSVTDLLRADFFNGKCGNFVTNYTAIASSYRTDIDDVFIWTDVTNNPIYRTSKLVLRRIPAMDEDWMMGTNKNGLSLGSTTANSTLATPHLVRLTSDYYIGVFPVTQMQYKKLTGSLGGSGGTSSTSYNNFTNATLHPEHESYPVYGVSYNTFRGATKDWTIDGHDVDGNSYLGKLRAKVGGAIAFDMPTEAQWEFASRGGNFTDPLYNGKSYGQSNLKDIGWCQDNSPTEESGTVCIPHVVGGKPPNAYGLYDTLGNINEWCLDWSNGGDHTWTSKTEPEVDPEGIPKASATFSAGGVGMHIVKGGSYAETRTIMHSGYRSKKYASNEGATGLRVCCPAD